MERNERKLGTAEDGRPAWPNVALCDSVHRWEDEQGRITHCTYQELWWDRYQQRMKGAAPAGRDPPG